MARAGKVDLGLYYENHYYTIHPDGSIELCDVNEIDLDTMKYLVRETKAFVDYCKKRKYPRKRIKGD